MKSETKKVFQKLGITAALFVSTLIMLGSIFGIVVGINALVNYIKTNADAAIIMPYVGIGISALIAVGLLVILFRSMYNQAEDILDAINERKAAKQVS